MKNILTSILFSLITLQLSAQFELGFDSNEVKEMIMLCNSYSFLELYGSDERIIPKKYTKTYTSPSLGMDNKYQIYEQDKFAVINFRGSTDKQMSWIENFYSAMIPATGKIKIDSQTIHYCFASNKEGNVHSGYALAISLLSENILKQITRLNSKGIYTIMITGHSQGGALAQLLRAYLENLPVEILSKKNTFKTYAFACPMVGNEAFSVEYNTRYTKSSFSILNPKDIVTNLPMTSNEGHFISPQNIDNFMLDSTKFDYQNFFIGAAMHLFENKITTGINSFGNLLEKKLIVSDSGKIEMPSYQSDINYFKLNKIIKIEPAIYPFDTKEPNFYQHKPYNYYVIILKMYFPEEYNALKEKYLTTKK